MRTLTIILVSLFLYSCSKKDECYVNHYEAITYYDINVNAITPNGIRVDTSGLYVDLNEIDRQVDDMERCLREAFSIYPFISEETAMEFDCRNRGFSTNTEFNPDITVNRDCLIVKIAPDWYESTCSELTSQQIFPCDIDPAVCEAKGLVITEECPCQCRSMIQGENIVITTPNFYIFRGELARMVTGCNNPWFFPIGQCLVD
ncbi:MAG: hypothetical protein HQ536_04495 [Parcubacteria group bacterium]|nr:hypothetical protein [Parcubacteria group bacterium]